MAENPSSPTPPLRIFVVENHADTRKYLGLFLEMLGHTVRSARSMAEALAGWPEAHCQVLISDIGLADGDGCELLRRLSPHPLFAIAMSGLGMNADRLRTREAGFRHYLAKPFEPDELEALLAEAAQACEPPAAKVEAHS